MWGMPGAGAKGPTTEGGGCRARQEDRSLHGVAKECIKNWI